MTKLLRLQSDDDTELTIPGATGVLAVLPPVVSINTTGIPAEDQIDGANFKAPRPGYYRFNSVACAQAASLGTIIRVFPSLQVVDLTAGTPPESVPRLTTKLSCIFNLKAGDLVTRYLTTNGGVDAPVWPQSESNFLEIEYLGEA